MKQPLKVHVVGGDEVYANWMRADIVATIEEADIVMFTGGVDVNPALYGKKAHWRTQQPNLHRDAQEISAFDHALSLGKPMIGICRGAQFLCAMSGGILVQDQKHPPFHDITTDDGLVLRVTSDHHQRAHPYVEGCEHKLLAWANKLSYYSDGENSEDKLTGPEAEVVYYPKTKALGIQAHPEWMFPAKSADENMTLAYFRSLISKMMEGKLDPVVAEASTK